MLSFYEWEKIHKIKPILLETPLVSEVNQFGGTIDLYADLNGKKVLIDLKTGKAIYSNPMAYQLAAYSDLLAENGHHVDYSMILNIPRAETESFESRQWHDLSTERIIFYYCLEIYKYQKISKEVK